MSRFFTVVSASIIAFVFSQQTHAQVQSPTDSITYQIQTYENVIRELQKNPEANKPLAHIMTQLGNLYSASEDYPRAINMYMRSIVIREKSGSEQLYNKSEIAWQLAEVGNSFFRLREYPVAIQAYRNAVSYFGAVRDYLGMITCMNNIGLCLLNQKENEQALAIFRKTVVFSKKIGDATRTMTSTIYLGRVLTECGRHEEAIQMLMSLNATALRPEDQWMDYFWQSELGLVHLMAGDTTKAVSFFESLSSVETNEKTSYYKASAFLNLALIESARNRFQIALRYANEAYSLLKTGQYTTLRNDVEYMLYHLYKKQGDAVKALYYYEIYIENEKRLHTKNLNEFAADYKRKTDQLAISREISRITEENEKSAKARVSQQRLSVFLVIISVLLVLVLLASRGLEARLQLLLEQTNSAGRFQKFSLWLLCAGYFLAFYHFFVPVSSVPGEETGLRGYSLIPGIIAFFTTALLIVILFSPSRLKHRVKSSYAHALSSFAIAFVSLLVVEGIYYRIIGLTGINFFLSLSLIVLASYIVPLFTCILVVENLVMRHVESISQSLTRNIGEIKQKIIPEAKEFTINSEKTSGKISFIMSDFVAVEAQGNYCMFHVLKGGKICRKMLHITMKSTEEQMTGIEYIIRCHKSYLVNIHHVVKVTGNSKGHFLHLDCQEETIPVSRGFQKDVLEIINKHREDIL